MPASGPTFTDWEQLDAAERRRPLLIDEDFSWSEPPARRRRIEEPATPPRRGTSESRRRAQAAAYEDDPYAIDAYAQDAYARDAYGQPAYEDRRDRRVEADPYHRADDPYYAPLPADAQPVDIDHELQSAWGGRLSAAPDARSYEVVPYGYEDDSLPDPSGRRTVVITGRGDGHYAVRRRRDSELAFHERASFSPDRTGMWAVLLGIALLIGCVAH